MKQILKKIILGCLLLCSVGCAKEDVRIVVPENAGPIEQIAAAELAEALGELYPKKRFTISSRAGSRQTILLAADGSGEAEGYVVSHDGNTARIIGADPQGMMYASAEYWKSWATACL
ncbi:glycoside hydrolase family 20 zincin-like fold domain-containing protein [Pontiella agarivorans]|uniref:Glycoside hydrolase family 20 zincin-like fold domain-containing protein n=1 Tax=Pontiella agarivorans TaxID=3038953 RepID=A0ABU5N1C9_9BACT|nr:glycoside hydrolase family 20 zincin-like fold domain-containing protein [Pontiella agarivorans]MDZ8120245.1 glycoside hydrolase family 20 zincin-like fold domain-containing protein [Pontiella agarivorans]